MNVAELISHLSKLPQHLEVHVGSANVYPAGEPQITQLYLENDENGHPDHLKPSTPCCTLTSPSGKRPGGFNGGPGVDTVYLK